MIRIRFYPSVFYNQIDILIFHKMNSKVLLRIPTKLNIPTSMNRSITTIINYHLNLQLIHNDLYL